MADQWPRVCRSTPTKQRLKTAKVLAVGAGGIGCELLKTLVLSGFGNIEVIDLDTIETSNLNRQFLFRKWHVGQSKALVAAQAVQKFRPTAQIKAHQGNIKEPQFGLDFFKSFDIVLNGLDNLEARRHVNRLCLASHTPLVESGTAGYLGQVSVHLRLTDEQGNTTLSSECYECQPKAAPKSYPVCTIRNTPDKPIHCIVWAKDLLFQRLFGSPEATSDLDMKTAEEQELEHPEANGEARDDTSEFLRRPDEPVLAYVTRIFERVYNIDVENLLSMEEMWKTRRKPQSMKQLADADPQAAKTTIESLGLSSQKYGTTACSLLGLKDSHKAWTLSETIKVFLLSAALFLTTRESEVGAAAFDKDDALAVEFVTAASNLRSLCYHIPTQSLFDAKGMAGNIIHAIATTNATIAGMIVVEAIKILTNFPKNCKVLKKRLSMNEPSIMAGNFAYEEGADLEPDEVAANARLLPLPLDDLPGGGLKHGTIVSVTDQAQDFTCQLVVSHKDDWDELKEPEGFLLAGAVPPPQQTQDSKGAIAGEAAADSSDDDIEVVEEEEAVTVPKRKRIDSALDDTPSKKRKAFENGGIISIN